MKRANRVAVLQYVESTFDSLPYDQDAARLFGQICADFRGAEGLVEVVGIRARSNNF